MDPVFILNNLSREVHDERTQTTAHHLFDSCSTPALARRQTFASLIAMENLGFEAELFDLGHDCAPYRELQFRQIGRITEVNPALAFAAVGCSVLIFKDMLKLFKRWKQCGDRRILTLPFDGALRVAGGAPNAERSGSIRVSSAIRKTES